MSVHQTRTNPILLAVIAACFVGIVTLLPFHAFISTWGGTEIGPLLIWKSWKELLLVALVPVVLWLLARRPEIVSLLWGRWVNRLIVAYAALHMLMAIISPASSGAVFAGLAVNLRFLAMFILAQIIVASSRRVSAALEVWAPKWIAGVGIVVSLLAIVQVAWLPQDFLVMFGYDASTIAPYILLDQIPGTLRAFATLRGPNDLGAFLLLPLSIIVCLVASGRYRALGAAGLMAVSMALVLTGSRSAWLGAIAALGMLAITMIPRPRLARWLKIGAVPALLACAVGLWAATTVPVLRLAVFHSSPGDAQLLEGSSEAHWQAVVAGVGKAASQPLGHGVGVAGPASFYNTATGPLITENYFVQLAVEVGIGGLALFGLICAAVTHHFWQRRQDMLPRAMLASLAGLTLINMLLHGWADDPTAMTWWAIAGLVYGKKSQAQS